MLSNIFNKVYLILVLLFFSSQCFANVNYLVLYKTSSAKPISGDQYTSKSGFISAQKNSLQAVENQVLNQIFSHGQSLEKTSLWLLQGTLLKLNPNQLKQLSLHPSVDKIISVQHKAHLIKDVNQSSLDHYVSGYTRSLELIKLPELNKSRPDLTGEGVGVGIIDTGLDASHPDLKGRLKIYRDFTNSAPQVSDNNGHGTHVAGTIAGGSTSGKVIGVAPLVQLTIAKTFGRYGGSEEADLLSALQWMADPDGNPATDDAPKIISNSWELDRQLTEKDPTENIFCVALDKLVQLGITPVFAAGNAGPGKNTIIAPGACPSAVTVAATDNDDKLADFSSQGPINWGTVLGAKPDVSAPGVNIYSAKPGGGYQIKSGTSMATPHVVGAAALILQNNPKLTAAEVKAKLIQLSTDLGATGYDYQFGYGKIQLLGL